VSDESGDRIEDQGSEEREQARGGSGEPPVPDEGTKPGSGEETTPEHQQATGVSEGEAHPGVAQSAAVQVPEVHEAGVPDDLRAELEEIVARYPQVRSASLPVLFAVQRRYGWCTPEGIRQGAAVMGVTAAYLESVASFYDLFHLEPAGNHRVLVCTNISCWMRGGDEMLQAFCDAAGVDAHEAAHGGTVSPDGEVFIQGFECLGACDLAPMASIDERYFGPLGSGDVFKAVEQLLLDEDVLPDKALERRGLRGGPDQPDDRLTGKTGPNA
jgi:NADH-quinone oxidoreductase subunit E